MTIHAHPMSRAGATILAKLRHQYEDEGFAFTTDPRGEELPTFLGSYVPDAVAWKPGHRVAIEILDRLGPSVRPGLSDIRHLFDGNPEWHLRVIYTGEEAPRPEVPVPALDDIRSRADAIRGRLAGEQPEAAFILAWSLLEAALRARDAELASRPLGAGTLVQALAMHGYIEPPMERDLRALIELRNRIVHGDLEATPTAADIHSVLAAVDTTLDADMS